MRSGESAIILPTKRFKITLDIPALVQAGVIPAEMADSINPEIRWEIGKQVLYRHEMMILDILGTNKFMRDINIMNPSYIRDVFPLVNAYSVQDGMNFKLLPYPSRGERYTEQTADFFIDGADGEPLKWGNLNSDIYVDPISFNMGTVQRQSMVMVAYDEYVKGNAAKARKLLDLARENFPASNFPLDVYAAYVMTGSMRVDVIDLYKNLYGEEEAIELWKSVFKYYDEEIRYLASFPKKKAVSVRGKLQDDLQIMALLGERAEHTLQNNDLAQLADEVLSGFTPSSYR